MKKRFIALLLCCVMLVKLSPSLISAASATEINGTTVETPTDEPPAEPTVEEPKTEGPKAEEPKAEEETTILAAEQSDAPVESEIITPTVNFTNVAPFLAPVTGVPQRRAMAKTFSATPRANDTDTDNGMEISKTATANEDGTYTIRMEAYTTGTVTTSTKTVPVDIVLVLDQSGSMAYDFNGNSTSTNKNRRQYALKQAVNNFIDAVNKKYDAADADHRIAIVTFGSDASTLQDWTYVDTNGKNTLQGKINGLPNSPSGATNAGAGMQRAEDLMGSSYNYTGNNTPRQKVVILFTDGVPTKDSNFETDVANDAIKAAKAMKDNGVTVYSVGIFGGADPSQLYGATSFDKNSDGSVGSYWANFSFWMIGDVKSYDVPAGNRFLNYLSSNFVSASDIGIKNYKATILGVGYHGWKITQNFDQTASNYYLTASDATNLNKIFQTISENIQSANIDLGSETVVKDTVSPYFDAPADASGIELYTAAAKAGGSFEADVPASGVTATIENNAVTVTGFDFNANFVSDTAKSDGSYGKKLIIEFKVTPKDGFIGGNDVPTNDWQNTGVYDKSGAEVEKFADATTTPTVNVPIDDVTVTAADKNVYLLSDLTAAQLKDGAEVKCGDVKLKLNESNYGLEGWQTEYVDITVTVKDKDGNSISDKLDNLTDDTTYTVEVTVAPKTAGTSTSEKGDVATAKTGVNDPAANIYVFKPELTFKDSTAYYGESVPTNNDYSSNRVGEKWLHDGTEAVPDKMLGTKPTLGITYTPDESKLDNGIYTKQDVPVKATVKIGTDDVTSYTTFLHERCAVENCGWETPTNPGDPAFLIHIQTCTLTVQKIGGDSNEPYVFDVMKNGKKYSEVTVKGNNSETIVELPVGEYTIQEKTDWSWRYNASYGAAANLTAQNPTGSIACTNTKNNNQWLNGFSDVVKNISGVSRNS